MKTLGAIIVVASLVVGVALASDVAAQQTQQQTQQPQQQPQQQPTTPPAPSAQPPQQQDAVRPSQSPAQQAPGQQPSTMPAYPSAQQPASPQPPSPAAQQPAGQQPGGQVEFDASAIIGSTVRDAQGKNIGKVNRLMVDPHEGRITTVVIGVGGLLGMGEKLVSMPWNAIKVGRDGDNIVLVAEQQLLEQAPSAERRERDREPAASPATAPEKQDDPKKEREPERRR
jgi:sporulation protein YlmC with PRC-barrel domain